MAVDSCRHLAHHRLFPNERHMKKMYAMLCLFGFMAGCNASEPPPLTPEQYKAQYEAKQEAERLKAEANSKQLVIPPAGGYAEIQLNIVCLQGIQYYHRISGHSVWFAPVMNRYSRTAEDCK
ncbi:hypothetical protein D3C75_630360 [compost metagenome]